MFDVIGIPLMQAATLLGDMPSFERMQDARSLSADMLAERIQTSSHPDEVFETTLPFCNADGDSDFLDTFLFGPGAAHDHRTYLKIHKMVTDQLVSDLLGVELAYLELEPANRK